MVAVLEEEVHARRPQLLEEVVNHIRVGGRLDDRQRAGEQERAVGVVGEQADAPHRRCVGALAAMAEPGDVVDLWRAVDADRHAGARLGKKIQQRCREQRAVGLHADGVAFGGQALAQATQQPGERVKADQ